MEPTLALLAAGGNTLVAVSAKFVPVGSIKILSDRASSGRRKETCPTAKSVVDSN